MNTQTILARLKQAQQATINLNSCSDTKKRKSAIEALAEYIGNISSEIEEGERKEMIKEMR